MSTQQFDPKMQTAVAGAKYPDPEYRTEAPSAPSVSEEMGYAIGDLTEELAKLTVRLVPVLRPCDPDKVRDAQPAETPMRRHLYDIHALTHCVVVLLERLDV